MQQARAQGEAVRQQLHPTDSDMPWPGTKVAASHTRCAQDEEGQGWFSGITRLLRPGLTEALACVRGTRVGGVCGGDVGKPRGMGWVCALVERQME